MAKQWIDQHPVLAVIVGSVIFVAGLMTVALLSDNHREAPAPSEQASQVDETPTLSAQAAAQEFQELMDLSEKSTLVSSYKFSDTQRVIYVTDVWYSMTVQFKKDFLAKVAMLRQAITGHHTFQVHHENSNEKVGEVTAFGGSLEVYK